MRNDSLEQQLHRLESDIFDFKKAQLVGSDSVRTFINQTNNNPDFLWTSVDTGGGFYVKTIDVTFTANTQAAPFASLDALVTFDGTDYDPSTITVGLGRNEVTIDQAFAGYTIDEIRKDNYFKWTVRVVAQQAGTVIAIKFRVHATDRGTVTVRSLEA